METLIVVFGLLIGLQVNNWNAAGQDRVLDAIVLEQLVRVKAPSPAIDTRLL